MTEYQTINWNGLMLEISAEPNQTFSRIAGEEYTRLKVTTAQSALPLIHDIFSASLIRQAGGAAGFVDVMLTAQAA